MNEQADWQRWFEDHAAALVLLARQWCADRADAEDAVQEAFIRAWGHRETVRDPGAYLFASARAAAMDMSRGRRRSKRREAAAAAPTPMLVSPIEADERRAAIEAALARLPVEQREVLVMKVWGGLTFARIGEALGVPMNTAASRYRYGIEALRRQLSEEHVR